MGERKKMSDVEVKFLQKGEVEPSPPPSNETAKPATDSLRQELLGGEQAVEASIRFTVDLPKSLHRRLVKLSTDSGKPKTELVRTMIRRALDDIKY